MNLRDAIEQQINLGEKDPYEIARRLVDLHGNDWLQGQIDPVAVAIDQARYLLGLRRRSGEARAAAHLHVADQVSEVQLESVWIDGKGYVREADLTSEDCRIRAAHHRKLAVWNTQKADQYERFAEAMESAGVVRLGDLLRVELGAAA